MIRLAAIACLLCATAHAEEIKTRSGYTVDCQVGAITQNYVSLTDKSGATVSFPRNLLSAESQKLISSVERSRGRAVVVKPSRSTSRSRPAPRPSYKSKTDEYVRKSLEYNRRQRTKQRLNSVEGRRAFERFKAATDRRFTPIPLPTGEVYLGNPTPLSPIHRRSLVR